MAGSTDRRGGMDQRIDMPSFILAAGGQRVRDPWLRLSVVAYVLPHWVGHLRDAHSHWQWAAANLHRACARSGCYHPGWTLQRSYGSAASGSTPVRAHHSRRFALTGRRRQVARYRLRGRSGVVVGTIMWTGHWTSAPLHHSMISSART